MQYAYDVLHYPSTETLNEKGAQGWQVYHVRPDSGGVPWFVYVMRAVTPEADGLASSKSWHEVAREIVLDTDATLRE